MGKRNSKKSKPAPDASREAPATQGRTVLSWSIRLARVISCLAVLAAGWLMLQSFAELADTSTWNGPQGTAASATQTAGYSLSLNPALDLQQPGYWRFGGWNWEIDRSLMDQPPAPDRPPADIADVDAMLEIRAEEGQLCESLAKLGARSVEHGPWTVHWLGESAGSVRLVTGFRAGKRWIREAEVCLPSGAGQTQLVRLRRGAQVAVGRRVFPLPLPAGPTKVLDRVDEQQNILAEMYRDCPSIAELLSFWKRSGCIARRVDGPGGQSWIVESSVGVVHVWMPDEGHDLLLATRQ